MARTTENPNLAIPPIEAFLKAPIQLVERAEVPEQRHVFDRNSAQAIRAALASRRPLLVRGEPGVGKTQLAAAAAKVLKRPLVTHVVDSRTESRDLLWTFDAVMRLADAQVASSFLPAMTNVEPNGDEAIAGQPLFTKRDLRKALNVVDYVRPGPLWWAFDWDSALQQAAQSGTTPPVVNGDYNPTNGRVVLIDEIDKADTDVPNGLLEAPARASSRPRDEPNPCVSSSRFPWWSLQPMRSACFPPRSCAAASSCTWECQRIRRNWSNFWSSAAKVHFPQAGDDHEALFSTAAKLIANERAEARSALSSRFPGRPSFSICCEPCSCSVNRTELPWNFSSRSSITF